MDQSTHRPDEISGYLDFLMLRRRVESNNSLLQHFGFREDPFRVNPDARYLFPSNTHLEALSSLENGFYNNRGFIAMIAPPGMGKTTLLYRFLEDTKDTARSTFIFDIDAECKPRDFVGYILRDFDIKPARSSSEMHKQLSEALIKETEAGRKCVIVIDEAQNLSDLVLERVRLLTNFENSQGKLLQIILSGQPQLTDKLKKASLVQLRQRVSTICHLNLLTPAETRDYIDYRLRQAGYEGEPLFTPEALDLIAEMGGGTPRTINNLCFNTLAMCNALQCKQADRDIVARVAESMDLDQPAGNAASVKLKSEDAVQGEIEPWANVNETLSYWWHAATGEVKVWVPALIGVLVLAGLIVTRLTGLGGGLPSRADIGNAPAQKAIVEPSGTPIATESEPVAAPKPAPKAKPDGIAQSTLQANAGNQSAPKLVGKSAPAQAFLTIDSNPAGADIEIDGAFVGNAPSIIAVGPGSHQVYVEMKGFSSWKKTLSVTGGKIHLNAELVPLPAQ
ncbi:MAG TPA: AAA family ATPase [Terracidiphilus sp.]|nr:AAA family ATPase [Terracidiphilus sp.]